MVTLLLSKKPLVSVPVIPNAKLENPFNPSDPLFVKLKDLDLKHDFEDTNTFDPYNIPYPEHLMLPSQKRGQLAALNGALDSSLSTIASVFYGATINWRSNDGALFTKLY